VNNRLRLAKSPRRQGRRVTFGMTLALSALAALVFAVGALAASNGTDPRSNTDDPAKFLTPYPSYTAPANDGLGVQPGQVKHVWLIILENSSFDAAFSGINGNTYLSQTLPSQGALLENYYGTGHSSLDNYTAMASGQAPIMDLQHDCDFDIQMPAHEGTGFDDGIDTNGGSLTANPNYGQFEGAAGPNEANDAYGCVYPSSVPTLFNQFDSAGVSWKGYAQDFDTEPHPGQNAGASACGSSYPESGITTVPDGAPVPPSAGTGANVTVGGSEAATSTMPANTYVSKHFPFPWFQSIMESGDCNAAHFADITSLQSDLESAATTPAFSWITPDLCSDGHDGICAAGEDNLSGGKNNIGGLYAADLFLEKYVPMIEASPAFQDGGLIDITFDEAYPSFPGGGGLAYSSLGPLDASTYLNADAAGETLFGRGVAWEPQGPNSPSLRGTNGQAISPGAGDASGLDRPLACNYSGATTGSNPISSDPNHNVNDCVSNGQNSRGHLTQRVDTGVTTGSSGSDTITDPNLTTADVGRPVSDTGGASATPVIPAGAYIGQVTSVPVDPASYNASEGSKTLSVMSAKLVDADGNPIALTGAIPADDALTFATQDAGNDPLYDAYDQTLGGGEEGNVLISPLIKPGTVSQVDYNHYSWLRTMEDMFNVKSAAPGLDGEGHIGYAAQPGLAPFGPDVFTAATQPETDTVTNTVTDTVTQPQATTVTSTVAGPGTTVTRTVTTPGPGHNVVVHVVPKVKGYAVQEATVVLAAAGLKVGKIAKPKHKLGANQVLVVASQSTKAGAKVAAGTKVDLVLKAARESQQ
jgi:Phosphoesterase family/PASTA domain